MSNETKVTLYDPKVHNDGTPEWYTPDGEFLVQYVADHPLSAIRLYQSGEINWEWSGTLNEAEQVVQSLLSAIVYARKQGEQSE